MIARTESRTIVAVFPERSKAQQAVNELRKAGFHDDQIGVTSREGKLTSEADDTTGDTYAAEAGAAGLATGAGVGALWGLAILSGFLPAIGPAIAGGTLAALLSSAAAGAAAAGLAGSLIGMGIPKDEAEYYETEFKSGRTIVTLQADGRAAEGLAILRRFGGYEKSSASSATGAETSAAACSLPSDTAHQAVQGSARQQTVQASAGQRTVQAREEQLHIQKQREQVGEVTVRKEVHTEHKTIDVPIEREEVVIERHAVSGRAATGGGPLVEGQQIRVPISEEHVQVTKTPVVTEEVTVGKRTVKGTEHVTADIRKEEIKVEKEGEACIKDNRQQQR